MVKKTTRKSSAKPVATITTKPDRMVRPGDSLKCDMILVEKGTYNRFKIGGVPKGSEGRKEHGGELIPGPWHYIFGLCTVIDNHGGTGAEMDRARQQKLVLEVSPGDKLVIDGIEYTLVKTWNGVMGMVDSKEVDRA